MSSTWTNQKFLDGKWLLEFTLNCSSDPMITRWGAVMSTGLHRPFSTSKGSGKGLQAPSTIEMPITGARCRSWISLPIKNMKQNNFRSVKEKLVLVPKNLQFSYVTIFKFSDSVSAYFRIFKSECRNCCSLKKVANS